MAWGTAASFAESYTRREHPARSSKAWNASLSTALRSPKKRAEPPRGSTPTGSRSPEMRTQPMVPPRNTSVSRQRSERRISVRLPMRVRGCDSRGVPFEEETSSENLCRSGAAFVTRFDVAIGSDLEIRIPPSYYASRRGETDFATQGRVVHVGDRHSQGEKLVGVQFIGPRFQRVFRSESAA